MLLPFRVIGYLILGMNSNLPIEFLWVDVEDLLEPVIHVLGEFVRIASGGLHRVLGVALDSHGDYDDKNMSASR
jgi:hypothetical protein